MVRDKDKENKPLIKGYMMDNGRMELSMGEEPIDFRMEINMRDNGKIIHFKVKGCLQRKEKDHTKGISKMECLKEREFIPMRTEIDMTDISRTTSGTEREYILGPMEIIMKADGKTTKPMVQDRF
jgi:hypothetical protein